MPEPGIRIPSDVEREDHILLGLTIRQVTILAITGGIIWLVWQSLGTRVPLPVFAVFALAVSAAGSALVWGRRDGLSGDQYVAAAWKYTQRPRRHVLAPDGIPHAPQLLDLGEPSLASLRLPVRAVHADGVLDLGEAGVAVIAEASTVGFALRTPAEQRALVGAFARWLNSLTAPIQIVVRAEWVDLKPMIAKLEEGCTSLAHPALEQAARDYAAFLAGLNTGSELLCRQVLLVLREPHTSRAGRRDQNAQDRVLHRVESAARSLAAAEITVTVLDGGQVAAVLSAAANPYAPPHPPDGWAAPDGTVTGTAS